ncbi:MAG: DUF1223 domain-containing protein [Parvularculales bacterium]
MLRAWWLFVFAGTLMASLSAWGGPENSSGTAPVVVELFTSQGCSSCPPADAIAEELTNRDDVLVLSLHVDYWDYLGWKDTHARPAYTKRQRDYNRNIFGHNRVYTPQVVVNGNSQSVGSHRRGVLRAIEQEKRRPKPASLSITDYQGGDRIIVVEENENTKPAGASETTPVCHIWMVRYHNPDPVTIRRGENAGRIMRYAHVVEDMHHLGSWQGGTVHIPVSDKSFLIDKDAGYAIILQQEGAGPIAGALVLRKPGNLISPKFLSLRGRGW